MYPLNEAWKPELDWETPAGKALCRLAAAVPRERRVTITVFGSAPLQMALDPALLSGDVDVFSDDDLERFIEEAGLTRGMRNQLYVQECAELNFKGSPKWRDRAFASEVEGCTVRFPHPIDILIGKLHRLDAKDLRAFRLVLQTTGHPTPEEMQKELQDAVDLFRPKFDEEATGDIFGNTRILWRELYGRDIDVRSEIIRPALERERKGYGLPTEDYKNRLREIGAAR